VVEVKRNVSKGLWKWAQTNGHEDADWKSVVGRKVFFAEYDQIRTRQKDEEAWPRSPEREAGRFETDCRD
jgi:hypothetical protein